MFWDILIAGNLVFQLTSYLNHLTHRLLEFFRTVFKELLNRLLVLSKVVLSPLFVLQHLDSHLLPLLFFSQVFFSITNLISDFFFFLSYSLGFLFGKLFFSAQFLICLWIMHAKRDVFIFSLWTQRFFTGDILKIWGLYFLASSDLIHIQSSLMRAHQTFAILLCYLTVEFFSGRFSGFKHFIDCWRVRSCRSYFF